MTESAAASATGAPAAPLRQPFTKEESLAFLGRTFVICVAVTTINALGLFGVFPGGNYSGIILGCSNLGLCAIYFIDFLKHEIREHGQVINKAHYLCEVIALLALNILAIQGTLSPQMLGMGLLLLNSFSAFIWKAALLNSENEKDRNNKNITILLEMIPLALAVISSLGVTGVIGGPHASLILGITALGGSAVYIVGKYWRLRSNAKAEDELPIYWKRHLLIQAIYGIGMAALALSGVSSITVGRGGLIGSDAILAGNMINVYLCQKNPPDQSDPADAEDGAPAESN